MKRILFKLEMIRAILEGKKIQTRRIHKDMSKPRYKVGEVVYVGETYGFIWDSNKACYAANFTTHKPININWKSGMFMPEKYARLFLKITGVAKQPLCDAWPSFRAEGFASPDDFHNYFYEINPFLKNELSRDLYVWVYTFRVVKK